MAVKMTPVPEYLQYPRQIIELIRQNRMVAIDTETTGLDTYSDQITVWSIATETRRAACSRFSLEGLREALEKYPDTLVIFHNAPFDLPMLERAGVDVRGLVGVHNVMDTLVMDSLMNPNGKHDLKLLSKERLGIPYRKYKSYGFTEKDFGDDRGGVPPSERMIDYASLDAWATFMIWMFTAETLMDRRRQSPVREIWGLQLPTMLDYYTVIEQPLAAVLNKMVRRGIRIDTQYMESIIPVMDQHLQEKLAKVCKIAGKIVNPNSAPQMRKLFFDDMGWEPPRRGGRSKKTGELSVDEAVLAFLMDQEPPDPKYAEMPFAVMDFRKYRLLKSTYVTGLMKRLRGDRIHTNLNQHVTATGRLSSSGPNLQNLPRASDPSIRRAFIASEGHLLLDADYSQIELRVLAHMARAQSLLGPLAAGIDLHSQTAAKVFNLTYEDVCAANKKKKEQRTKLDWDIAEKRTIAKAINFGIPYGISGHGLQRNLKTDAGIDLPTEQCDAYLDAYWVDHPDIYAYNERLLDRVRQQGEVRTLLGRPRPISGLHGRRPNSHSVNQTYNTPIQGSAGELLKLKMIEYGYDPELEAMGVKPLLQVHDELLFEVPKENAPVAVDYVKETMAQSAVQLLVRTPVDVQVGQNWGDLH